MSFSDVGFETRFMTSFLVSCIVHKSWRQNLTLYKCVHSYWM